MCYIFKCRARSSAVEQLTLNQLVAGSIPAAPGVEIIDTCFDYFLTRI